MILDASIFSRAIKFLDVSELKKIQNKEGSEVVLGRLTSMTGSTLQYGGVKVRSVPDKFEDGKVVRVTKEINSVYSQVETPSGATFKNVMEELNKLGLFPVLFPVYLKGTVGGFIATNGSGFGSYRFGFVSYKKNVHSLENDLAYLMVAKYTELIETKDENYHAWSGIMQDDGSVTFYSPAFYSSLIPSGERASVDTWKLIKEIDDRASKTVKRGYVPLIVRSTMEKLPKVRSSINMEYSLGYVVNYNSPVKYGVLLGSIEETRVPEILSFLKENPDVYPWPALQEYDEVHKLIISKVKKAEIKVPKRLVKMRNEFEEGMRCVNCGACLDSCLSFRVTKNPLYSPPGRFGRMLNEANADYCFGCKECEDACPVGIPISSITETIPKYNEEFEKLFVETPKADADIKQLVADLETRYKNRPVFLLFAGCSTKYDPLGLKGFLGFLSSSNGNLPSGLSPRVSLMDGECCGFADYVSGNESEAKKYVDKIKVLKDQLGAQGVYFLCPEGLYVYNKLSGDKGVLAYDVVKDSVGEGEVHAGCWARKLGIEGKHSECAGIWTMTYKGKSFPINIKNYLTICPFSTWKFGTTSVYSKFIIKDENRQETSKSNFNDTDLLNVIIDSINRSLLAAADEIAGKVYFWKAGGSQYFVLISSSIAKKYFYKILFENITKNKEVKEATREIIVNKPLFDEKIKSISEIISHQDFSSVVTELQKKILQSQNLEYSMSDVVNSKEFVEALSKISKTIVSPTIISDALAEAAYL
ncbi:4Fe-4S dicluster domain-containing protein [Sulfuracidifex tepidarius]|uniref:4Fe-4S ferredoxin-type domain-containing protein n=1 Tax=Sulfuracidifex tepidarius TaxID=1294262 RepID=A0A510E667_9CREN|nr:4Fe-4S dicluster domain-containing protein [Sulfuracidifex tepidarius]BBG25238.1 hypothetical protein IC006_2573 [Sulfuracidifex tepidarius]BBG28032.1 hypothetical protein IC007_2587 [Sulfuracidifex tepidarius]